MAATDRAPLRYIMEKKSPKMSLLRVQKECNETHFTELKMCSFSWSLIRPMQIPFKMSATTRQSEMYRLPTTYAVSSGSIRRTGTKLNDVEKEYMTPREDGDDHCA